MKSSRFSVAGRAAESRPATAWSLAAATLVQLAAGALRVAGLDRLSLWADEGYSVALSSLSYGQIWTGTAAGQHPPLYYWLLHGWMALVGTSAFATRLLSALIGWVTVAMVYRIGGAMGRRVALAAAVLLAVSPAHVWYSHEARMYTLLAALATLSTWLAWQWWARPEAHTPRHSALYVGVTLAALYTHNMAVFVVAGQNLAAVLLGLGRRRAGRPRLAGQWLLMQVAWALGYLPWLTHLLRQASQHEMVWIPFVSYSSLRSAWLYLTFGSRGWGGLLNLARLVAGLVLLAAALGPAVSRPRRQPSGVWPAAGGALAAGRVSGLSWNRAGKVAWPGLCFLASFAGVLAVGRFMRIYEDKQVLMLAPLLLVVVAAGFARLPARLVGPACLLLLALSAQPLVAQYTTETKQDWRGLAQALDGMARAGDAVYLNPHAGSLTLDLYANSRLPQAGYPPDYSILEGGWAGETATPLVVAAQVDGLAQQAHRVWLVEFVPGFWDPQDLIRSRLRLHYPECLRREFDGVSLSLFLRKGGPAGSALSGFVPCP